MTTWHYRIMRSVHQGEAHYGIHEVYVDDAGNVKSWTENPVTVAGESVEEIQRVLMRMAGDCARPILNAKTGKRVNKPRGAKP